MIGKLLSFLAWAGLYSVPLTVLNGQSPSPRTSNVTPIQAAHITSNFMDRLVDEFVTPDGRKVSYLALKASKFYGEEFANFRSLLKVIDPSKMPEVERKSFFINLYNILTIDALLSMDSLPRRTISVTKFWSRYAYEVGPYTLHLDDIEHGILRGNRPHPTSSTIMFESNDPRLQLTMSADNRIHGALNCGAMSCPPLRSYSPRTLEHSLDAALKEFCTKGVTNVNGSSLIINQIFEWFSTDFARTEQLTMRFLSQCVDDPAKQKALAEAAEGRRRYTFYYDWKLNAVKR